MKAIGIIMILIAIRSCLNYAVEDDEQVNKILQKKASRGLETDETIILSGETYSVAPVAKPLKISHKTLPKTIHRLESGRGKHHKTKPDFKLLLLKGNKSDLQEIHRNKQIKHLYGHGKENIHGLSRIHRRHFDERKRNYRKTRQQQESYGQNKFISFLPSFVNTPPNYRARNGLTTSSSSSEKKTENLYNLTHNIDQNYPWTKSNISGSELSKEYYHESSTIGLESTNLATNVFPSHTEIQNYDLSGSYEVNDRAVTNVFKPLTRSAVSWITTKGFSTTSKIFNRAAVIQENLPTTSLQTEIHKDEDLPKDEGESDDISITFGGTCDLNVAETCWFQREVGDTLTLSVKINSSKKADSFQIHWMKVYHIYESKKGKVLEIGPTKFPWNMVCGSEGRELRLNPVTNTDMDPNSIVAKVFLLTKNRGKTLFTELKKLTFRIDIPIIEMGKIYAGQELSINIENFISLPEQGNLLFEWILETKPRQYESLPSNVKVSNTGRSVVLKELKKGRMGVLNCIIYSPSRFAVAKRRFNILKIGESVKRRSTPVNPKSPKMMSDTQKKKQCRHVIRRDQEMARQRLEEGKRPKSRRKRFRRMQSDSNKKAEIDCGLLRKKVYSRWIRSLFGEFTTEDPKLMPLEKLFELSEQGDGTLDNEIPHEIHYVPAMVRSISGTLIERSHQLPSTANCTSNEDCGQHAICVKLEPQENASIPKGYCNCRREFYGDGFTCLKIPFSNHREKRLRRSVKKIFAMPKHLFYEHSKEMLPVTAITNQENAEEEDTELPTKVLAFEEEESFLLSDCIDDRDCSVHASCIQPANGHPYCQCRPGFRGNGIFCWEIIDYVPPEEHFLAEDQVDGGDFVNNPVQRTPTDTELEDEKED